MQSSQRSWRSNAFQKGSGEAGVDKGHTSTMNGQLFGSRCHDGTYALPHTSVCMPQLHRAASSRESDGNSTEGTL